MAGRWLLEITTLRGDATLIDATAATGVSIDRYTTGKVGSLTATIPAPNPEIAEQLQVLVRDDATLTLGAYLYRNNEIWFGGRIDAADVAIGRDAASIALAATSFEGYLDDRTQDTDIAWSDVEQLEIARAIWTSALAGEGDMGITVPTVTASGQKRDLTVPKSDARKLASMLGEISHRVNGFEWMINTYLDGDTRKRELLLGYPSINRGEEHTFTYPGNLLTFGRKTVRSGTRLWARGAAPDSVGGDQQPAITSPVLRDEELLGTGAVLIDNVLDESDIKIQATLDARGAEHYAANRGVKAYVKAQVRIDDVSPSILGTTALLRVSHPLYPAGPHGAPGHESEHRVIGISIQAGDRDQDELGELIFEEV